MKTYGVKRIDDEIALDGDVSKQPWAQIEGVEIDCFPWYSGGEKQATRVKACYSGTRLYLLFECEDRHISASRTGLNSEVWKDSCVELFASLPEDPESYFNLEMNCCGEILMGYGPGRAGRRMVEPQVASLIEIWHSVPGPSKEESPDDDGWVMEVALPFGALSEFAGCSPMVRPGVKWRANFQRCGGLTDPQSACWSPIESPQPDYHRPEHLGVLEFGQ